jgi:dynein heavy chain 1
MKLLTTETRKVEQKSEVAERTKRELEAKQAQITERSAVVNSDLARAEPALIAAQNSVSGVQAKDLKELQGYRNPPEKVKLGLSSCVALVKNLHAEPNWANAVLPALRQDGFKASILDF